MEGIGLIEAALVVTAGAVAIFEVTPQGREATAQAIADGLDWATEQTNESLQQLRQFAKSGRGDGGASSSAQHLAMLLGLSSVAGFPSHPGKPDPEGRDRKHNAEGLRNDLSKLEENMKNGKFKNVNEYLRSKNWTEKQIQDYLDYLKEYLDFRLPTDVEYYNVSDDLAQQLVNLGRRLGIKLSQW